MGHYGYESYPCTCYMRLGPLLQSHINADSPVTLNFPREKRRKQQPKAEKQRRERKAATGRPQDSREHSPDPQLYR